ncbi:MAG: hypothetical protein JWL81_1006, partial [Verrucomicrobiales bacterium]|nr:hypothetical protein [Verrucomicrobiales bacterium]
MKKSTPLFLLAASLFLLLPIASEAKPKE